MGKKGGDWAEIAGGPGLGADGAAVSKRGGGSKSWPHSRVDSGGNEDASVPTSDEVTGRWGQEAGFFLSPNTLGQVTQVIPSNDHASSDQWVPGCQALGCPQHVLTNLFLPGPRCCY